MEAATHMRPGCSFSAQIAPGNDLWTRTDTFEIFTSSQSENSETETQAGAAAAIIKLQLLYDKVFRHSSTVLKSKAAREEL